MFRRLLSFAHRCLPNQIATTLLDLPNELIVQIANGLSPDDLDRLLRTNHFLAQLLSPVLMERALVVHVGAQRRSVLHWASAHDQRSLVALLLARGAHVNVPDINGMTALHSAVIHGYDVPVTLLLRSGAHPNLGSNQGWTPLLLAAVAGYPIVTRLLVLNGAHIDATPGGFDYQNALHHAAGLGHMAVVDVLISMGCEMGAKDLYGVDAAQSASLFGQDAIVNRLSAEGFCLIPGDDDSSGGGMQTHSITATKFRMYQYQICLSREHQGCRRCRQRT